MSGRKTLDIDNITLRTIRAINPQTNLNPTANYILAADGSGNATWVNTITNINTYGTGFTGSSGTGATGPAGLGSYISATYAGDNVTPTAGQWSFDDAIGLLIGDTPLISTFMAYLTALVAGGNVYLDYINATLNTVPFPPDFGFSAPPALASGVWTIQTFTASPIGLPTGDVFNFWVQGLSPYGSTGSTGPTGPGGNGGGGGSSSFYVAGGEYGSGANLQYSTDGITWADASSGIFENINCRAVAYNGLIWLAGFEFDNINNPLAYSSDGINWTPIDGSGGNLRGCFAIAWNGTMWVAGGVPNGSITIIYSYDGNIWYPTNASMLTECHSIAWNGTLWVAGGYGPDSTNFAYSYDGIIWNRSYYGFDTTGIDDVDNIAWNGTIWVAAVAGQSCSILTSYDGINWTPQTQTNALTNGVGVATNGSIWVVGGLNYTTYDICMIYTTTPDPQGTWYNASPTIFNPGLESIASSIAWGEQWIAGGKNDSGNAIAYSSDGINWTLASTTLSRCYAVASNRVLPNVGTTVIPNRNVGPVTAVATAFIDLPDASGNTNALVYTRDGMNWQSSTNGSVAMGSSAINFVSYNGIQWVAGSGSANDNGIIYSSDGITWYPSDASGIIDSFYTNSWNGISWNGSRWVAGRRTSAGEDSIIYSINGINWSVATSATSIFTVEGVTCIGTSGPLFVASGLNMPGQFGYSTDGINWTGVATGSSVYVNNIAWNGSYWLAVGTSSSTNPNVLQSSNGIIWSETVNVGGSGSELSALCWNGSYWVTFNSASGYSWTSTDGTNWTSSATAFTNEYIVQITWDGSKFLGTSEGFSPGTLSSIYYSYDGLSWAPANCIKLTDGTSNYAGIASNRVLPNVGQGSGGGSSGTGATGPTGSGAFINWTGPYNAGTTYNLNDGVIGPDGYGYVLAALASAGTAPPNSSYWALVSTNMATGNTGPTGYSGSTGYTGSYAAATFTLVVAAGSPTIYDNATVLLPPNGSVNGQQYYEARDNGLFFEATVPPIQDLVNDQLTLGFREVSSVTNFFDISNSTLTVYCGNNTPYTQAYDNSGHVLGIYMYYNTLTSMKVNFYLDGALISTGLTTYLPSTIFLQNYPSSVTSYMITQIAGYITGGPGPAGPTGLGPTGQSTQIRSGTGAPSNGLGNLGDFYIDISDISGTFFYGPKTLIPLPGSGGSIDFVDAGGVQYVQYAPGDINLGTSPFTIESWFYTLGTNNLDAENLTSTLFGLGTPVTSPTAIPPKLAVGLLGYPLFFGGYETSLVITGVDFSYNPITTAIQPLNTWYNFAITYDGTDIMSLYVDGILEASGAIGAVDFTDVTNAFTLGNYSTPDMTAFYGQITNFQVSDVVRYTGNYAVNTSPLVPDANSLLLLDASSAPTYLSDSGINALTPSVISGTAYSTNTPFTTVSWGTPVQLNGPTGPTGPAGPAGGGGGGTGYTGPTGPAGGGTGATGPTGSVLIYATVFDGGNASTNYIIGPVFNCGGAQ